MNRQPDNCILEFAPYYYNIIQSKDFILHMQNTDKTINVLHFYLNTVTDVKKNLAHDLTINAVKGRLVYLRIYTGVKNRKIYCNRVVSVQVEHSLTVYR